MGLPLTIASFYDEYGASSSRHCVGKGLIKFLARTRKSYRPGRDRTRRRHALSQAFDDKSTPMVLRRLTSGNALALRDHFRGARPVASRSYHGCLIEIHIANLTTEQFERHAGLLPDQAEDSTWTEPYMAYPATHARRPFDRHAAASAF
jgi:hypothetical protein